MSVKNHAAEKEYHFGHMTIGQCIETADALNMRVGDVILEEAMTYTGESRKQIVENMESAFTHNIRAATIGLTTGHSILLGEIGKDLNSGNAKIVDDPFVNRIVTITLAAQVGNHTIGLRPCAGTGDSCPYTGFVMAVKEFYPEDLDLQARVMAVILKIGGMYRIGKCTTGCNMEGIGAGACASAAAFVELAGGTPRQMEAAMVLAISPTIAVPCTPPRIGSGALCHAYWRRCVDCSSGQSAGHVHLYSVHSASRCDDRHGGPVSFAVCGACGSRNHSIHGALLPARCPSRGIHRSGN